MLNVTELQIWKCFTENAETRLNFIDINLVRLAQTY